MSSHQRDCRTTVRNLYFPSGHLQAVGIWDGRNESSGGAVYYGYDAQGRRSYGLYVDPATGNQTQRLFFYDTHDRLIAVEETPISPSGPSLQEIYFWADNEVVFRYVLQNIGDEEERAFFYNDHVQTVRSAVAVDFGMSNPVTTYTASNEPFLAGVPAAPPTGAYPVRMRFPGQWTDDASAMWGTSTSLLDTGMTDLSANTWREYDPGIGGYSAADPVLLGTPPRAMQGPVLWPYTYADGRPTTIVDATGRIPVAVGALCAVAPEVCILAAILTGAALYVGLAGTVRAAQTCHVSPTASDSPPSDDAEPVARTPEECTVIRQVCIQAATAECLESGNYPPGWRATACFERFVSACLREAGCY
jgi:hypothetical protein